MLPVPRVPRPPVHHGEWLPWWRVQVLSRVWLPCPDSSDSVHQEDPALKRGALSVDLLVSSSLSLLPLTVYLFLLSSAPSTTSLTLLVWRVFTGSQIGVRCLLVSVVYNTFFFKETSEKRKDFRKTENRNDRIERKSWIGASSVNVGCRTGPFLNSTIDGIFIIVTVFSINMITSLAVPVIYMTACVQDDE